jgi:hypothetical protein
MTLVEKKLKALRQILAQTEGKPVGPSDVDQDAYGFVCGCQEWLVLTDAEATAKAAEYISESVWAFKPEFLAAHSDCTAEVFKLLQDSGKCEDLNTPIKSMIRDWDHFVQDAIKSDGRGHFMCSYDGEEYESKVNGQWFFAYRVN